MQILLWTLVLIWVSTWLMENGIYSVSYCIIFQSILILFNSIFFSETVAKKDVKYYECCVEPYPSIYFSIFMKRRTLFFGINLIVPCLLSTVLTIFGFAVPSKGCQKITLRSFHWTHYPSLIYVDSRNNTLPVNYCVSINVGEHDSSNFRISSLTGSLFFCLLDGIYKIINLNSLLYNL